MKKVFLVKCYMGNVMTSCFMVLAEQYNVDDMVGNVNSILSHYHSDDDLCGHPMEKTLRDIRGASQYRMRQEMIDSYPKFGSNFYNCDRIEKENVEIFEF